MTGKTFLTILLAAQLACATGGAFAQNKPKKTSTETSLRIMTYNIHHANPPSRPGFIDLDAIARVLIDSKADVIGLQEVENGARRSGTVNQAKLLAEKMGFQYHFFKAIDYDGGGYGIAVLSRYELHSPRLVMLPQLIKAEQRILGYVTIIAGKHRFIFANTHLDANKAHDNRVAQIKRILEEFEKESLPVVLVGDLNAVAGSEVINLLDSRFSRTCKENCGFTSPQINPRRTIDFIATRNASWSLTEHRVIKEKYASDHRPVTASFKLQEE